MGYLYIEQDVNNTVYLEVYEEQHVMVISSRKDLFFSSKDNNPLRSKSHIVILLEHYYIPLLDLTSSL